MSRMDITVGAVDLSSDADLNAINALTAAYDDEFLGGHDDLTADESRAALRVNEYRRMLVIAAQHPAHGLVGVSYVRLGLRSDTDKALFWTHVGRQHRGQGIGSKLAEHVAAHVRELGRPQLRMSALVPAEVCADDPALPSTRIATKLGMVGCGVDVARAAPLPLPGALLEPMRASLTPARGYTLISWRDRTPEEHLDELVDLINQLTADAPHEDKQIDPDVWTPDRLRDSEQRTIETGFDTHVVAAVDANGRLAGYTELSVKASPATTIAWQGDTVVARQHRGHGLGLTMKLASHTALGDSAVTSVATWNSQANPWMIAINEALGYRVRALQPVYRSA